MTDRAANHTDCKAEPGELQPRVDLRRCEGKAACARVCPYGVFQVGPIAEADYRAQSLLVRLKLRVHGKRVAYTSNADACRGCGLCVSACPEKAIKLARR